MALKDLTTPTMITILDALLDSKAALPAVKALPRSAALIPDLETARKGLQDFHAVSGKGSPELAKVQARAAELDGRHDRMARGLDGVIEGLMELTTDSDFAAQLGTLRTEILGPKGLLVVSSSHADEAQNAKLVDKRLTEESKVILDEVTVHDRTLGDWVKDWQKVARDLGKADAERTALEANATTTGQPSQAVRARNTAIRTLNAFMTMLDLDDPSPAIRATILGPLDVALSKAERRGKKGALAPAAEPPEANVSVGGSSGDEG